MDEILEIASPAPVLNISDFVFAFGGEDGKTIPTNERGHPYCFEFVALKGMQFKVLDSCSEFIVRVSHPSYPEPALFLDRRFTQPPTSTRMPQLPPAEEILSRMKRLLGKPYVWGGNWGGGIPELLSLYPPKEPLEPRTKTLWSLEGVDCSGLLYEATGGATPRNTSQLIHFGLPLKINTLSLDAILSLLRPLDMVLYKGHVFFVADSETAIESKSPMGVIQRNLRDRLNEVYQERRGVNTWDFQLDPEKQFVIRRFV